jgi:serine/threonine protein kinase
MGHVESNGLDQFKDGPLRTQDPFLFPNGEPKQETLLRFSDEEGLYSQRLDSPFRRCLAVDPAQRLSLVELSHEVALGLNTLKRRYPTVETWTGKLCEYRSSSSEKRGNLRTLSECR